MRFCFFFIRIIACFVISFLTPAVHCRGQAHVILKKTEPRKALYFNYLTRREGLPSNNISCALQDHEGFMWIGTENGLVRYDGNSVMVFQHDPRDPTSIADNAVTSLTLGPDSMIWVGTINGLSVLDPASLRAKNYSLASKFYGSQKVLCVHIGSGRIAWIGTMNGIFRMDPGSYKLKHYLGAIKDYSVSRESKLNEVTFFLDDPRDTAHFLAGTTGGLILFDKSTGQTVRDYRHIIPPPGQAHYGTYTYYLDDSLHLWTHGWMTGLNMFDLKTEKWTDYHFGSDTVAISYILAGNNNELWLATMNAGLILMNMHTLECCGYRKSSLAEKSLISDYITFLTKDRNGHLWVMCDGGVCTEDKQFRSFHKENVPLPHSWVSAFSKDRSRNRLYVGAYNCDGLFFKDESTDKWFAIQPEEPFLKGGFLINTLFRDKNNVLWIGSRSSLFFLDEKRDRLVLFRTPDGNPLALQDNVIYAIYEDRIGNLWLGTRFEGVVRIDPSRRQVRYFRHLDGDSTSLIAGSHIRGIHEDRSGRIWIGTQQGFCLYDPATGKFSSSVMKRAADCGILQRLVYTIEMDTLGRMWLSSDRQGLLRIGQTAAGDYEFKLFTTRQGLYDAELLYFTEDAEGNFWIVNNGLVCMNPYTESFRTFSVFNGLHEPVKGDVRTYIDDEGNIYVGDERSYETINKRELMSNTAFFNLVMEGIDINGSPYPNFSHRNLSDRYIFHPYERNLTFRYTAVNFNPSNQVTYQYFLEGYDHGWSRPDQSREARYTNLPPGTYTFHVRATSGSNVTMQEKTLNFKLRPQFWKTWWFVVLCLVSLQFLAYLLYRYRRNQMIRMENLRTRIASDLHDDVSSTLSSISILSSLLAKKTDEPQISEMIGEIGNSARGMLEQTDDIIWAVNPKNDRFQDLGLRVREYAIPLLESKNIRFRIEYPESLAAVKIPMDVRRNLYLIAKEAVNNLIKYSECTTAEIIFSHEHSRIHLEINDNGKGFEASLPNSRNGIRNMTVRAERINARFSLDSEPGMGARIRVELKIK